MLKKLSIGIICIALLAVGSAGVGAASGQGQESPQSNSGPPVAISSTVFTFTATVYSDGYIDVSPVTKLDSNRAARLVDRLVDMEDEQYWREKELKKIGFLQKTNEDDKPKQFPAGDRCHAKTKAGKRCSRGAKGTTGLCWQHQGEKIEY